jgi:hypothetical protein
MRINQPMIVIAPESLFDTGYQERDLALLRRTSEEVRAGQTGFLAKIREALSQYGWHVFLGPAECESAGIAFDEQWEQAA